MSNVAQVAARTQFKAGDVVIVLESFTSKSGEGLEKGWRGCVEEMQAGDARITFDSLAYKMQTVSESDFSKLSQDLDEWIRWALAKSEKFSSAAGGKKPLLEDTLKTVLKRLEDQMCVDKETMAEFWDDIKLDLPGVPRGIIGQELHVEKYARVVPKPEVSGANWLHAGAITVVGMLVPCALSVWKDRDGEREEVTYRQIYEVWVPLALVFTAEMVACSFLGPKVGYDMIQQRSSTANLRDAMRNNMTNQAVIGALFLTVVWAMAQADPPVTRGMDSFEDFFVCQWYQGFVVSAIGQLLIAIMVCCFNVMYIEPLDEIASMKFVKDNFSYFGEPMALMLAALYNAICATILWVFGAYGFGLGICFSLATAYSMLRGTVVYVYLGKWENPYLTHEEKKKRESEAKKMVTAAGELHYDAHSHSKAQEAR
mmetsp:Transcript_74391/g.230738  ORF Transcript_74391/g.230738 Transcript_74391/m.230738 type:complete len:427 (-) Transcript_74391:29-1309(-)